jgi:hypothetical protein
MSWGRRSNIVNSRMAVTTIVVNLRLTMLVVKIPIDHVRSRSFSDYARSQGGAASYLAGTGRHLDPSLRQEASAAVVSTLTPGSVSAESASTITATAVGDPFKASGTGRLGGTASRDDFLEYKTIAQIFVPPAHH